MGRIAERIADIRRCLPATSFSVRIHLQTTPSPPAPKSYPIAYHLNNQLRKMTVEEDDLCLIDYDWAIHTSTPEEKRHHTLVDRSKGGRVDNRIDLGVDHLFRDKAHPTVELSRAHAIRLLHRNVTQDGCLEQPYV